MQIKINNINSKIFGSREELLICQEILFHKFEKWIKYKKQKKPKRKILIHKFINQDNIFPTGLLYYLLLKLKKKGVNYQLIDLRKKPELNFKEINLNVDLYNYQKEAIENTIKYQRVIWEIATNGGKTLACCGLVQRLNTNTLFLVHNKILFEQTLNVFKENFEENKIGYIKSGEKKLKKFVVAMIPTLAKSLENKNILEYLNTINLIIGDEAHRAGSRTYSTIFNHCPSYYRVLMSGTIPEEETLIGKKVRALSGNIVIKISNDDLIQRGISSKPICKFINIFGKIEIEKTENNFLNMARIGLYEYEPRNNLIIEEVKRYVREKKSIIVLVWLKEHGEKLTNLLKTEKIKNKFITGNSKDSLKILEEFKKGKLKTLITTPLLDEGFDTNKIEVLILAGGGKSNRQLLQRVGRGLRKKRGNKNLIVVDFIDNQNLKLLKHSLLRKKILERENFEIIEI